MAVSIFPALFAIADRKRRIGSIAARARYRFARVNTSLAGAVFFGRLVYPEQCISIPEGTQRISHLTTSEGHLC